MMVRKVIALVRFREACGVIDWHETLSLRPPFAFVSLAMSNSGSSARQLDMSTREMTEEVSIAGLLTVLLSRVSVN